MTCFVGIRGHVLERYLSAKLPGIITACLTVQPCAGTILPSELGQGSFRGERRFRARLLVWPLCPFRDTASTSKCASEYTALPGTYVAQQLQLLMSLRQLNLVTHNAQLTCAMLAPKCTPALIMEATRCIIVTSGSDSDELGNVHQPPGSKPSRP